MWLNTYLGPPDLIIHNAGPQFDSSEFRSSTKAFRIRTKCVPVEAHHSIGLVERYHTPLRRAYDIIRKELPQLSKEFALQAAAKTVNDTTGPEGIIATLRLFGAYPRILIDDAPSLSILERGKAVAKARDEVSKLYTKRQVRDALNQRNGPDIQHILDALIGDQVLVYREKGGWKGPYTLIDIKNNTKCIVQINSEQTSFRITSVRKYFPEQEQEQETEPQTSTEQNPIQDQTQADTPQPPQSNQAVATESDQQPKDLSPLRTRPQRTRRLP